MALGPSRSSPLLPGLTHDTGDTAGPQDAVTSHPEETRHALQIDRSRIPPGAPEPARQAPRQPDAAFDREPSGGGPETLSRDLDGPAHSGEAGQRSEPDRERSAGAGAGRPAGEFALRVSAGRNGTAF